MLRAVRNPIATDTFLPCPSQPWVKRYIRDPPEILPYRYLFFPKPRSLVTCNRFIGVTWLQPVEIWETTATWKRAIRASTAQKGTRNRLSGSLFRTRTRHWDSDSTSTVYASSVSIGETGDGKINVSILLLVLRMISRAETSIERAGVEG